MKNTLAAAVIVPLTLTALILSVCPLAQGCAPAEAQWVGPIQSAQPENVKRDAAVPLSALYIPSELVRLGLEIKEEHLLEMSKADLRVLRNTIFARHGRPFEDEGLRAYFEQQVWYWVDPEYSDDVLTPMDLLNVSTILRREGQVDAAMAQQQEAMTKGAEELARSTGDMEVLDAFLTDLEAVEDGTAPAGFEQPPLAYYKDNTIKTPLTLGPQEEEEKEFRAEEQ